MNVIKAKGTITWEEFVVGVRHILAVSDAVGDGWNFRGSMEEHGGGYLAKRVDYPVAVGAPPVALEKTFSGRAEYEDAAIDHGLTEPFEIDPCSIGPDSAFRSVYGEFHVLYSLAHAVPILYLRAWRPDGSSLEAKELWRNLTTAEQRPSSDEPERLHSLTQQEHPFLGEPWYHLHPCRTADLMDQIAGNDVEGTDAKVAPPRSRDEVYSGIVRLPEMEMVRAFTTRLPVVGTTGTTLQRNITIYVLVAGIAGGLLLILAILLLCKYCSRLRSRTNSEANTTNPVTSGWGTEVSVALTSTGISKVQHRLTGGSNNNKSRTTATTTDAVLDSTLSLPAILSPSPLVFSTGGHQHLSNIGSSGSLGTSPSPIIKDDLSDSYVIQVEPIRVMAASPSSLLDGVDSWASDESPTTHRRLLTVNEELDGWTRRMPHQNIDDTITAGSSDNLAVSPVIAKPADGHRRSLRHAATHDDGSASSSAVSKRRLDWRNSHRNYRSAPTAAASRDSYALNYDSRRALRSYHQRSIEVASAYLTALPNRRVLHRRGGSMREPPTDSLDTFRSSSTAAVCELTSTGNCLASAGVAQQQHPRCQMMASPATKRWRCHTVDCPCSNNVTASAVKNDLALLDDPLTVHRHSFPSSEDLISPSSSNRHRNYHQHRREDQQKRTKESLYDGYLNRSESLDWARFQTRTKSMINTKRDEATSVIVDIDGTGSQLQSASAGPVPRITIRYNDPGSLESVNEDNLFFCLDAGSKNEFRQRLEKTIDAQYRQVWELRANLEEHSGFFEPSSPEPEAITNTALVTNDVESFDSNSESLASEEEEIRTGDRYGVNPSIQEGSAACETKVQSPTTMLHPPMSSGSWKRQSYRNVSMNSRLSHQTGPISPLQKSSQQQPQSSFDSIDTIETSSTEPSRMDQVTTSFESSATDSTNGLEVTSIQPSVSHHRMLALRNDSGYRSLESAVVPASGMTKTTTKGRISLSEDDLIDPHSVEAACQCRNQVFHDEKCERQKPIVFARCTRYAMKVRSASTSAPHSSSHSQGWEQQHRLQQHHSQQLLTRDYSIDERTDALFREFSRCDPVFDSGMKNVGGGSRPELQTTGLGHRSRWINQHQRHDVQHHYQHRFISSEANESLLQHCSLKE